MAVKIIKKKKKIPYSGVYSKEEAVSYFGTIEGKLKYISTVMSGYGKPMWLDRSSGELVLAAENEEPASKLAQLINSGKP